MNREEFIRQLEQLLADVSEEERQEALAYYNGYFEDAGSENEQSIIRELESPQKVAANIKAGLCEEEAFTEVGKTAVELKKPEAKEENRQTYREAEKKMEGQRGQSGQGVDWTRVAFLIIAAVVTAPLWGSVLGWVFGVVFGLLGGLIGIAIGLGVGGGALLGVGIGEIIGGSAALGFLMIGLCMFMWAVTVLGTLAFVAICVKVLPWIIRNVIQLIRWLCTFGKRQEEEV